MSKKQVLKKAKKVESAMMPEAYEKAEKAEKGEKVGKMAILSKALKKFKSK